MAGNELFDTIKEFLFPGRFVRRAIGPLDSALTPNTRLEDLEGRLIAGLNEPDDVVLASDGATLISSGTKVYRFDKGGDVGSVYATLPGEVGPLCMEPDGRLLVGVAGHGLMAVSAAGEVVLVCGNAEGRPVTCPTDITRTSDGTIYVSDGSTEHHGDEWVHDLIEKGATGRILRVSPGHTAASVVRRGLHWPSGITTSLDESRLIVCEAWAHNITSWALDGNGDDVVLQDNLPGYPGRISTTPDGGFLLAVFALRTQLVDFVLTQPDFAKEMMRTIEPDFWIRPALRSLDSGLEPLQGGQIRKLGVIKPWAPPRSYGLCVRLDATGRPVASMHSRVGGTRHGVTTVRTFGDEIAIAVRGGRQVLVTAAKEL